MPHDQANIKPHKENFAPRRAMDTSSEDSICRKLASSEPQRTARRRLSMGVKLNSSDGVFIKLSKHDFVGDDFSA